MIFEKNRDNPQKSQELTKKISSKEKIALLRNQADQGDPDAQFEMAKYYKDVSNDWYLYYLQLASANGHPKAQYFLAEEYDHCIVSACKPSYGMAAHYYKLAADQGIGEAQVLIGYYFEYGLGIFQSYEKAAYYYQQASDLGLPQAYALLGNCYEYGHGVQRSMDQAKHYYALALEGLIKKDPLTYIDLGKYYFESAQSSQKEINPLTPFLDYVSHTDKSFRYMEHSHRQYFFAYLHYKVLAVTTGDINAFNYVINCYKTGSGVPKNFGNVQRYCNMLADSIQEEVTSKLQSGNSVDKDVVRFLKLHEEAKGDSEMSLSAKRDLAWCYKNGIGTYVKASPVLFSHYLEESAIGGYVPAVFELGECYDYGIIFPCDPKKAVEYFLEAADRGYAPAQYAIGNYFEYGIAVGKSREKALEYYQKSADRGYVLSIGKLGRWHELNNSASSMDAVTHYYTRCAQCKVDEAKILERIPHAREMPDQKLTLRLQRCYDDAFLYYRSHAECGDPKAERQVGDFYRQGFGVIKSVEIAMQYYVWSADQEDPKGQRWLGYILEREDMFEEAFKYYKMAAVQGDPCAMGLLAQCYEEGKGVFQCVEEANYYYEFCAKAKWDEEELYESSFDWGHIQLFIYNKARAALGSTEAQNIVAGCYERGDGTIASQEHGAFYRLLANSPEESKKAVLNKFQQNFVNSNVGLSTVKIAQLEKDAKKGDRNAIYQLAECYLHGNGIPPSKEKYKQNLILAAAQGHKPAFTDFSSKYDYGMDGFFLSYEDSASIVKSAAEAGNTSAKTMLGYFFEQGLGLKKSYKRAISWYEKAVQEDDYLAMWHLAHCYEFGRGVTKAIEKANEYYSKGYSKVLETDAYSDAEAHHDIADGRKYLTMASKENSGLAGYFLERSFRHFQKAFLYFRAKATTGDINAIRQLAGCYHDGIGVEKSEVLFKYYSEIASKL